MNQQPDLVALLKSHRENETAHFRRAATFLTRCQLLSPYVEKGLLRGVVCPWEIKQTSQATSPILEDFHDTLEAIWVWSHYRKIAGNRDFDANVEEAWSYVSKNLNRFQPFEPYDASHALLVLSELTEARRSGKLWTLRTRAVETVQKYLSTLDQYEGREYHDPFWMLFALSRYGRAHGDNTVLAFVRRIHKRWEIRGAFHMTAFDLEPKHIGPGNHDFFSSSANKVLAFTATLGPVQKAKTWLEGRVLPLIPKGFVSRHVDENPWNAHVASAMAIGFNITNNPAFLREYFSIVNELMRRDKRRMRSLPRQPGSYRGNESWVTFFWSFAYAELCRKREPTFERPGHNHE